MSVHEVAPVPADRPVRRVTLALARGVAVVAGLAAVGELIRWANRSYIATQYPDDSSYTSHLVLGAHAALTDALAWLVVAFVAAAVGWRVQVRARRRT